MSATAGRKTKVSCVNFELDVWEFIEAIHQDTGLSKSYIINAVLTRAISKIDFTDVFKGMKKYRITVGSEDEQENT